MRTTSGKSASRPRRGQTIADDRSSRRGCFAALGVWHISHGSTTMSSIRTYDHPHAPLLAPNLNERTRLRGSVTWSIVCEKHAEHCTPPNDYGRYPRITSAAAAFPCAVQSLLQPLCTTRESWSRAAFQCLWCTAPIVYCYIYVQLRKLKLPPMVRGRADASDNAKPPGASGIRTYHRMPRLLLYTTYSREKNF